MLVFVGTGCRVKVSNWFQDCIWETETRSRLLFTPNWFKWIPIFLFICRNSFLESYSRILFLFITFIIFWLIFIRHLHFSKRIFIMKNVILALFWKIIIKVSFLPYFFKLICQNLVQNLVQNLSIIKNMRTVL